MKRRILMLILCVLGPLSVMYLQFGQDATINHITTTKTSQGYDCDISITLNKLVIFNEEKWKSQLTQKILDNTFKNMLISDEALENPSTFHVTVYANDCMCHLNLPHFSFTYSNQD